MPDVRNAHTAEYARQAKGHIAKHKPMINANV